MEAAVNSMVSSSSSTIEGRPHTIANRRFAYKPDKAKATWQLLTLADFSFAEEQRILKIMDNYCSRCKAPYAVDCKLEVFVECKPLQKAFSRTRYANEPSSLADG
jgi:cytochrome c1